MQPTKADSLREAQVLIEQGRWSLAIKIYQKIVDDDLWDLNSISTLAELYVKAGRAPEAAEHLLRIADNYLRGGSAKSAAYIVNKVLKLDSANPTAYMMMGELHLADKDVARAHEAFIEAGAAFWRKGNVTSAIAMNQRALEALPESRHARAALAFIQREINQSPAIDPKKEVAADLPPIIISIPDGSDDVCAPLTFSENPMGLDPAPVSPQRALTPNRDEDAIIRQIAVAEFLVGCGQVNNAIGVLRASLIDQPDHIQLREKLRDIYLRSEMIDRASEECVNIAAIYLARGETSRAAEYVARARALTPATEATSRPVTPATSSDEPSENMQSASGDPLPENTPQLQVM